MKFRRKVIPIMVGTVTPFFFWRQCCRCGQQVRRQRMWFARYQGLGNWTPARTFFLCDDCGAVTLAQAERYFDEQFEQMKGIFRRVRVGTHTVYL